MNGGIIDVLGAVLGEDLTDRPVEYILLKMMQRIEALEHRQLVEEFKTKQNANGLADIAASLQTTEHQLIEEVDNLLARVAAVNKRLSAVAESVL